MSTEMKTRVIGLLETYLMRDKQIDLLHYELAHPSCVSPDEMIEAMSFTHGEGVGQSGGYISDKTRYIALNYQAKADKANSSVRTEIIERLAELENEQRRLRHYVSLLKDREAKVISLFYFEGRTAEEVSATLGIAMRTVYKIKARAIDRHVEMYEFSGALS